MRRFACLCLLCLVAGAEHSLVFAQGEFVPYGASRGHIRRVHGPWRSREVVRWGNGVTPVGAQVLMQGLTVAGNVLTSPSFLSQLAAPRAAEDLGPSEASAIIREIEARNRDLQAATATLLRGLDVPPAPREEVPPGKPELSSLMEDVARVKQEFEAARETLRTIASEVSGLGQSLLNNRERLGLTELQVAAVRQRVTLLEQITLALQLPASPGVAEGDVAMDGLRRFARGFQQVLDQTRRVRDGAMNRVQSVRRVLSSDFAALGRINESQVKSVGAEMERVVAALDQVLATPMESLEGEPLPPSQPSPNPPGPPSPNVPR